MDTHGEIEELLTSTIGEALMRAVAEGFEFPLTVVAIGSNGGIVAVGFRPNEHGDGLDPIPIVDGERPVVLPANIVVADARGSALRVVLTSSRERHWAS